MGLLLKLALLGVVAWGAWVMARRWLGLSGSGQAKAPAPDKQEATPPQSERRRIFEDTHPCPACGAYVAAAAEKCGRADCPQPA